MDNLLVALSLPFLLFVEEPVKGTRDIPRFQQVSQSLYRGGLPKQAGFVFLKETGIKTVINLMEENDEERVVRGLGMNYVHIPMRVTVGSRISDENIIRFFEVVRDQNNFPVFVHCRRGADRTGIMVGLYRIDADGWTGAKAYSEARKIGMRWWYRGLKKQLNDWKPSLIASRRP